MDRTACGSDFLRIQQVGCRFCSEMYRDSKRIEYLLDGLLDFCFDPRIVNLFKRLCRYYYQIDSTATGAYVKVYRVFE